MQAFLWTVLLYVTTPRIATYTSDVLTLTPTIVEEWAFRVKALREFNIQEPAKVLRKHEKTPKTAVLFFQPKIFLSSLYLF